MRTFENVGKYKMNKKFFKIALPVILALLAPFPALAEAQTQTESGQEVNAANMSGILVSFLYLAAVLALIYVILLLIERYAKKNPPKEEDEKEQEQSANEKAAPETKNGEAVGDDNKKQPTDEDTENHE